MNNNRGKAIPFTHYSSVSDRINWAAISTVNCPVRFIVSVDYQVLPSNLVQMLPWICSLPPPSLPTNPSLLTNQVIQSNYIEYILDLIGYIIIQHVNSTNSYRYAGKCLRLSSVDQIKRIIQVESSGGFESATMAAALEMLLCVHQTTSDTAMATNNQSNSMAILSWPIVLPRRLLGKDESLSLSHCFRSSASAGPHASSASITAPRS